MSEPPMTVHQPNLFEAAPAARETENAAETTMLFALGEFQARGKVLANRELPLDRLRGAFKRAAARFGTEEFSDDATAKNLEKLGAKIVRVPSFVAKHPFRVTVFGDLAARAADVYRRHLEND